MLAPVFDIHDRARSKVNKLRQIFLRPSLCLSLALDLPAQRVEVKPPRVLVQFYLTPTLFYISGMGIGTKLLFTSK